MFVPLPLKKPFMPEFLYICLRLFSIPIEFSLVCDYIRVFRRSKGAVTVLEKAPATAPDISMSNAGIFLSFSTGIEENS